MEHEQATAIARGMIAKMVDPTGRYKEIEIATGLDIGVVRVITYRMRAAGLIPTPRKRGCTKTDIARQMLIDGIGEPIQYVGTSTAKELLTEAYREAVSQVMSTNNNVTMTAEILKCQRGTVRKYMVKP